MWAGIAGAIQILLFLCNLWKEKNKDIARKKAEIAKELIDAFAETDSKIKASRINAVVGSIRRM